MALETVQGKGLLLIGDAHLADNPPGQRLEGYLAQVMDKLKAGLDRAVDLDLVPVLLGDLFHWPRDNSNKMLVDLIRIFGSYTGPYKPWVLVGNHDKYLSRFTDDVSLAVLEIAGVVNLMKDKGPQFVVETPEGRVLVGASPDGAPLPKGYEKQKDDPETVVWVSHHNIKFGDFKDRSYSIKELPGIDWLINGHIHRPQEAVRQGQTTWANPGNITRLTFTRMSRERKPAAHIWRPGCADLESWELPHMPFAEVFPDQEFPPEEHEKEGQSQFLQGLERLAWRRTHEGVGLKEFLQDNLDATTAEGKLIWELYEEVIHDDE